MKKNLIFYAIIFTSLTITNISAQQNRTETFIVKDRQINCEALVPQKCLQVKRENQTEFKLFYDPVENFDFIAGYEYVLRVEVIKLDVTPKDTSGFRYLLKEIVSRKPVEREKNNAEALVNRNWRLKFLRGKEIEKNRPFIRFEYGKNKFSGSTGCNNIGGQYEIEDDSIKFSKVFTTKKACLDPDNPEAAFLESFGQVDRFEVYEDSLYLYSGGVVVLHFEPRS